MTNEKTARRTAPPRRRLLAVLFAPLGVAPLLAIEAWNGMEMSSLGPAATLWNYIWTGLLAAYLFAAPAGAIVWGLLRWTKAAQRAWLIVLLFTATLAVLMAVSSRSLGGVVLGALFGLSTSLAYCLFAGVPWSIRSRLDPSRLTSPSA